MANSSQKVFIIVLCSLVAAVALLFMLEKTGGYQNYQYQNVLMPPAPASFNPPLVYAAKGELTPGFPKELILDDGAKLSDSYSIAYDANLKQYTATFDSQKSMKDLFALYQSYFPKNEWMITNQITKYTTSRGLYAKKNNDEIGVAIISGDNANQVVISYVVK